MSACVFGGPSFVESKLNFPMGTIICVSIDIHVNVKQDFTHVCVVFGFFILQV